MFINVVSQLRIGRVATAVLVGAGGVMLAFCLLTVRAKSDVPPVPQVGDVGLDFLAFYGAGTIVREGYGAQLFDRATQVSAQQRAFDSGGERASFVPYPYPPATAIPYAILSRIGYRTAYWFHSLLMLGLLFAAVVVFVWRPGVQVTLVGAASLYVLAFIPTVVSIVTGQNATLSLFIVAMLWRAWTAEKDLTAGLVSSLLLFKPQLGVPWLAFWLLARNTRAISGWMAGAGAFYAFSSAVSGWDWPQRWVQRVLEARSYSEPFARNAVAWSDMATQLPEGAFRMLFVVIFCGGTWLFLSALWHGSRIDRSALLAVTLPLLILGLPHGMLYDAALVLPSIGWLHARSATKSAIAMFFGLCVMLDPRFAALAVVATAALVATVIRPSFGVRMQPAGSV